MRWKRIRVFINLHIRNRQWDRLPATLQLNEATAASDLPRTVKALLAVLKGHKENISVTFSGYMSHLDLIRLRLKEQGLE